MRRRTRDPQSWRVDASNTLGAVFRSGLDVSVRLLLIGALLTLAVAAPAVAQTQSDPADGTNPLCQSGAGSLATFVEAAVQLTTGLGIMLLLLVWQGSALLSMMTVGRDQKAQLKEYKRGAFKSAGVLLVSGPLFTLGGSMMGLPIAQCVDLVPF